MTGVAAAKNDVSDGTGGFPALVLALALGVVCAALAWISLGVGPAKLDVVSSLADWLAGSSSSQALIVGEIRLPRTLLALLIGATLGISGAALQGLLRNPLAEPGVVGVSGMAALFGALAFYAGWAAAWPAALPLAGMLGALVAVAGLAVLAGRNAGPLVLVLAGVALSSLAGALTTLVLNLSPNPFAALEIFFWLLGSLADRDFSHVLLAVPPIAVGIGLLFSTGRALDALSLGPDVARSLGINLAAVQARLVLGVALAVGASVAVAGAIGFVGLVVPHLLRPLVGYRPARLLWASALGGAALTIAADVAVRTIPTLVELKLGVVTALIGAPFFLALVLSARRAQS